MKNSVKNYHQKEKLMMKSLLIKGKIKTKENTRKNLIEIHQQGSKLNQFRYVNTEQHNTIHNNNTQQQQQQC